MRKPILAAVLGVAVAFPVSASAQEPGFYVGLGGGLNLLSDSDFDILGSVNVDNDYDPGFVISGTAGYDFGNVWKYGGLRGEAELSYRENDIDTHNVAALGGDQPGSTGEASTMAIMLNALHDFETGTRFRPYLGGGVGFAWNDLDNYGIRAVPNVLDDDDSGFAWQLIAGVGYDLTDNVVIAADYRYFSTNADVTSSAATGSQSNDVDLDSHSVMLSVRYRF